MFVTTIDRKEITAQTVKTAAIITAMVVLPFLIHLIPFFGNVPLGAIFLPMFIAPLIGAYFTSSVGLAIAALAAPLLNHALTGMPVLPNLYVVMIELLAFSLAVSWAVKKGWRFTGFSMLAFLAAKLVAYLPAVMIYRQQLSLGHFGGYLTGLKIALPGVLVLLLVERILAAKKA